MSIKICHAITAFSSSIIAIFCVWIFVNLMIFDRQLGNGLEEIERTSLGSKAQMTQEGDEIIARLNAQTNRILKVNR